MEDKVDWIKLHKLIHKSIGCDPQFAKIDLESRTVSYDFFFNAIEDVKSGASIYGCDGRNRIVNAEGFTTALKLIYPRLSFEIERKSRECEDEAYFGQISMIYHANSKKEFDNIVKYLHTVPCDGGEKPKEDETFFCYD
jgi:hypothetical protein